MWVVKEENRLVNREGEKNLLSRIKETIAHTHTLTNTHINESAMTYIKG